MIFQFHFSQNKKNGSFFHQFQTHYSNQKKLSVDWSKMVCFCFSILIRWFLLHFSWDIIDHFGILNLTPFQEYDELLQLHSEIFGPTERNSVHVPVQLSLTTPPQKSFFFFFRWGSCSLRSPTLMPTTPSRFSHEKSFQGGTSERQSGMVGIFFVVGRIGLVSL